MKVPSGRTFDWTDIEVVTLMAKHGFILYSKEPIMLKSGIPSHVYVVGREDVTDNPFFELVIGRKIAGAIYHSSFWDDKRDACLIGIPTAGTVLAQAAAMSAVSYTPGVPFPLSHRLMREVKKSHGIHSTWVNGRPDIDHVYWMIDNVATDGASKIEARKKLREDNYPVAEMPCLIFVDRQQGAVKRLEQEGFQKIVVAYNLLDITYALSELNLWPRNATLAVEEEIKAHQARS